MKVGGVSSARVGKGWWRAERACENDLNTFYSNVYECSVDKWKCQRAAAFKTMPHFFLVLMNTDKSIAVMITNLFQASLRFSEWQEHSNFFFMFKNSYMSSVKYDPIPYKLTAKRVVLPRPVQDQSSLHSAQMKWMISRPHPYWRGTLRAGSQGLAIHLRLVSN